MRPIVPINTVSGSTSTTCWSTFYGTTPAASLAATGCHPGGGGGGEIPLVELAVSHLAPSSPSSSSSSSSDRGWYICCAYSPRCFIIKKVRFILDLFGMSLSLCVSMKGGYVLL